MKPQPKINFLVRALRELKLSVFKVLFFETIMNAVILFLVSFLIFSFFGLPVILALSVTSAYIIVDIARRIALNKIRHVEAYYPRLNEKLRTAAEYARVENPVANELQQEVLNDLKGVEESEFLEESKTLAKAGIIGLLCLLILFLAPVSVSTGVDFSFIGKVKNATANITFEVGKGNPSKGLGGLMKSDSMEGAGNGSTDDIYGDARIARLGDEELKLIIKPSTDSVNIRQVRDVESRDFLDTYPKEVVAVSSAAYDERIPKEQQEIVKNYFTAIANS
ncbi:hypothetical protein HYY72_05780 [Candidatus Woesearchaeota archaeon]|nr:hypothetical protein [Candidatus Woesearchaeota archaeon]